MFIFCLSNCKKKKGPSEPTQETKKTSCTNLNLFGIDKLPAVDPAYLKVGSMQVDQFRNNNYSVPSLTLSMELGSPEPDVYIYNIKSATTSKSSFGLSSSGSVLDREIPIGTIKLEAWACVRPERASKRLSSRIKKYKNETFYCGDKFTPSSGGGRAIVHNILNSGEKNRWDYIANIEDRIMKEAIYVHRLITSNKKSFSERKLGVFTNSVANMEPQLYAELVSARGLEAFEAFANADYIQNKRGFRLTQNNAEECAPDVSPADLPKPPTSTGNATGSGGTETGSEGTETGSEGTETGSEGTETGSEGSEAGDDSSNANDEDKDPFAAEKEACDLQSEKYIAIDEGSAYWDAQINKCLHISKKGSQQEINPSIDPGNFVENDSEKNEPAGTGTSNNTGNSGGGSNTGSSPPVNVPGSDYSSFRNFFGGMIGVGVFTFMSGGALWSFSRHKASMAGKKSVLQARQANQAATSQIKSANIENNLKALQSIVPEGETGSIPRAIPIVEAEYVRQLSHVTKASLDYQKSVTEIELDESRKLGQDTPGIKERIKALEDRLSLLETDFEKLNPDRVKQLKSLDEDDIRRQILIGKEFNYDAKFSAPEFNPSFEPAAKPNAKSPIYDKWNNRVKKWNTGTKASRATLFAGGAMAVIGIIGSAVLGLTNSRQKIDSLISKSGEKIYKWKLRQQKCLTAPSKDVAKICRD